EAEQNKVTGHVHLTPIQELFFQSKLENLNYWNQSLLFIIKDEWDTDLIKQTAETLVYHHDALRIKINYKNADDEINQEFKEIMDYPFFEEYNIENGTDKKTEIEEICSRAQASLNLERGEIFKLILLKLSENEARIFFVIHHIAIDGVSWRILLEDFQFVYTQLKNKLELSLNPKTTSFKEWSSKLLEFSKSEKIKDDIQYWTEKSATIANFLPIDNVIGVNNESSAKDFSIELDENKTQNILRDVNNKYNTKVTELLLTALLRSYSAWTGKRAITINLENHGRDVPIERIDLSRTIGWFTTLYPCHLDLQKAVSVGESITKVKEQLRLIPNDGNTYGLIRFLQDNIDVLEKLKRFDNLGITFNYLGQFDNVLKSDGIFSVANESKGFERDPKNLRDSLIDVTSNISGGKLRVNFSYSENIFERENISIWARKFEEELLNIIEHCLTKETKTFTSSDFNLSNLNDKKLDKLLSKLKKK
ncbi:MAG: non-ribosomal peptide synthetase, partial [Ignavibacteriae bacterium]|nr:non-ribosomal peptide synthetase [Ignavibacteriota bacterium]